MSYAEPSGPGVRVDSGVREGSVVGGQFDSMLAKLIVYGENRTEALRRASRALAEYRIEGLPTIIPFHRDVVDNPAFIGTDAGFDVYTKWIEEEWDNQLEPYAGETAEAEDTASPQTYTVEVDGRRLEVALPADLIIGAGGRKKKKRRRSSAAAAVSGNAIAAPMQGTVIKVNVAEGDEVAEGDVVAILEAMKMENPVKAHKSGTVAALTATEGAQVTKNDVLMEIE